jgi:hypothetical protein
MNYIAKLVEFIDKPVVVESNIGLFGGIVIDASGKRITNSEGIKSGETCYFLAYSIVNHLDPKPEVEVSPPIFAIRFNTKPADSDLVKTLYGFVRNGLNLASSLTDQGVNMINIIEITTNQEVSFGDKTCLIKEAVISDYVVSGEILTLLIISKS